MTGDGTCGVFIPEGFVVGKVAEPMGGRVPGRDGWSHNRLWKGEAYIVRVRVGSLLCTGWLSAFLESM
jgi:hypothetical protein